MSRTEKKVTPINPFFDRSLPDLTDIQADDVYDSLQEDRKFQDALRQYLTDDTMTRADLILTLEARVESLHGTHMKEFYDGGHGDLIRKETP